MEHTWQTSSDDKIECVRTADPRVVAVIERDDEASLSELFDGDGINPIFYREYRGGGTLSHIAGYNGSLAADAWTEAYKHRWSHDSEQFADRFVRIFYGAHVHHVSGDHGHDRGGEYLVFDDAQYREHVGDDASNASAESAASLGEEVAKALSGEVYGIGYAINDSRLMEDDAPIDLDDGWVVEIECWGLVGEEYAKSEAASFSHGEPNLPEFLSGRVGLAFTARGK